MSRQCPTTSDLYESLLRIETLLHVVIKALVVEEEDEPGSVSLDGDVTSKARDQGQSL